MIVGDKWKKNHPGRHFFWAGGVFLGVSTPTLLSPRVWPLKAELAGEDPVEASLDDPKGRNNYPSASDFAKEIRTTFLEEVPMAMTVGPLTKRPSGATAPPVRTLPRAVGPAPGALGERMPRSSKTPRSGPQHPTPIWSRCLF